MKITAVDTCVLTIPTRRQMALQEPDIVLLDLMLPDGSGMELFHDAKQLPNTELVLITGHASLETSIQALRLGAADYLVKPMSLKQLKGVLSRVTRPSTLKAAAGDMQSVLDEEGHFGELWGRSPSMRKVYQQIVRVAGTNVSVCFLLKGMEWRPGRYVDGDFYVEHPAASLRRSSRC